MKVLFAIAEADPFVKTGGLGDVGGSLPKAINKRGGNVRVILPQYSAIPQEIREQIRHLASFKIELGWRKQYCGLGELNYQGVSYYFIDNEYYFKRENLYGYADDAERFAFFNRAVLDSLPHLDDFRPELLHCHDWHTSLIPVMLKEYYNHDPFYYGMKSILTIHNLKHQGVFPKEVLADPLGMDGSERAVKSLNFYDGINYLKGGLLYADGITTVSSTYAGEIQDQYFGEGLDEILRQRKDCLYGILNGIDYDKYNPMTDQELFVNYRSSLDKKADNKMKLQSLLDLPVDRDKPMLALISRLVDQKGLDLLAHILDELLQGELQLVILGIGDKKHEEMFYYFADRYPNKIAVKIMFDESLARKIYAGADLILMPSKFEPCGLTQMIAMRYSTLPVVRETGGLKDSVIPFNKFTEEGNGFSFANYNAHEFLFSIQRALKIYYEDKVTWKKITEKARQRDFSWDGSAQKYIELYEKIITGVS